MTQPAVHPPRPAAAAPGPVLSVVIPALDEEAAIGQTLERLLDVEGELRAMGVSALEIWVVDDGSRDRTAEIAEGFAGVRVVRHGANRGYGAAIKTGLARARGELVAFLDADGTYPPESFPRLAAAALDGGDLVIGSRMSGAASRMPRVRRVGNLLFARLVGLLAGTRVADSASGMRVIRRSALDRLYPLPHGLNFTPVMSLRALHEGLEVAEVPIPYEERIGPSKLSVVRDGFRFLWSLVWTALAYNPVRVLGAVGLAGVAVAAVVGAGLVAARLAGVTALAPWAVAAVFLALVCGVAGISLLTLGVSFNYLVALFRHEPVKKGLFSKPLFDPPLDRQFLWIGAVCGGAGVAVAAVALGLGLRGWPIERLWLYLVGAALLILVGLQLAISWVVLRVLEELADREARARRDSLGGAVAFDGE